jgi:nucleotide-binding universal stress UspA family protein
MSEIVVIGVSGSEHAHPAVTWGVEYAREHELRIELTHVVEPSAVFTGTPSESEAIVAAEVQITEMADRISSQHPDLAARGVVMVGVPETKLISRAGEDEVALLVIGSHSSESDRDAGLYSRRAARIAAESDAPVVVVPHRVDETERSGVVVGIDGSELSIAALRFAADVASRLGEPLTAVHAWQTAWPWGLDGARERDAATPEEELILSESLAGIAEDFPDLEVRRALPRGYAAEALDGIARDARLLAVGSRGVSSAARFWLGSVSTDVLLRMPTVVAVVR